MLQPTTCIGQACRSPHDGLGRRSRRRIDGVLPARGGDIRNHPDLTRNPTSHGTTFSPVTTAGCDSILTVALHGWSVELTSGPEPLLSMLNRAPPVGASANEIQMRIRQCIRQSSSVTDKALRNSGGGKKRVDDGYSLLKITKIQKRCAKLIRRELSTCGATNCGRWHRPFFPWLKVAK